MRKRLKNEMNRLLVFAQFLLLFLLFLNANFNINISHIIFVLSSLIIAALMALWTFSHNHIGNFNIVPDIKEECCLITSGPYKYIRHPMYFEVLMTGLGSFAWFAAYKIVIFILLVVVLYAKATIEERLWCERDVAYQQYKKQTKMFIPFVI